MMRFVDVAAVQVGVCQFPSDIAGICLLWKLWEVHEKLNPGNTNNMMTRIKGVFLVQ